jgi:hypothetical protein
MPEESVTEQRKAEHVDIILKENVEAEHNFWNDVHLIHESLPEVDYEEIDISTKLFGRKLNAPIVIASKSGLRSGSGASALPWSTRSWRTPTRSSRITTSPCASRTSGSRSSSSRRGRGHSDSRRRSWP